MSSTVNNFIKFALNTFSNNNVFNAEKIITDAIAESAPHNPEIASLAHVAKIVRVNDEDGDYYLKTVAENMQDCPATNGNEVLKLLKEFRNSFEYTGDKNSPFYLCDTNAARDVLDFMYNAVFTALSLFERKEISNRESKDLKFSAKFFNELSKATLNYYEFSADPKTQAGFLFGTLNREISIDDLCDVIVHTGTQRSNVEPWDIYYPLMEQRGNLLAEFSADQLYKMWEYARWSQSAMELGRRNLPIGDKFNNSDWESGRKEDQIEKGLHLLKPFFDSNPTIEEVIAEYLRCYEKGGMSLKLKGNALWFHMFNKYKAEHFRSVPARQGLPAPETRTKE